MGYMDFSYLKTILGEKVDLRTSIFQVQRTPKINQVLRDMVFRKTRDRRVISEQEVVWKIALIRIRFIEFFYYQSTVKKNYNKK